MKRLINKLVYEICIYMTALQITRSQRLTNSALDWLNTSERYQARIEKKSL